MMSSPSISMVLLLEKNDIHQRFRQLDEFFIPVLQPIGIEAVFYQWIQILSREAFFQALDPMNEKQRQIRQGDLGMQMGRRSDLSRRNDQSLSGCPEMWLRLSPSMQRWAYDSERFQVVTLSWTDGRMFQEDTAQVIQQVVRILQPHFGCLMDETWETDPPAVALPLWKHSSPLRILGKPMWQELGWDPTEILTDPDLHKSLLLGEVLWLSEPLRMAELKGRSFHEVENQLIRQGIFHREKVDALLGVDPHADPLVGFLKLN